VPDRSTTPRGLYTIAAELNAEADRLERENVYSAQGITRDWLRDMAVAVLSHASETAPPSALSLEYAGRQGYIEGYADALKDLGQQSANMPTIPGADKIVSVTRAFDYVSEREGHSPWVMVYFPPNDWASRDAFAAALPAPADSEAKDA
jgi:hypothetical protein